MAAEQRRDVNEITTETLAQSWAEKGEAHRALAFQLAHDSLKEAAKRGLPIESWRDADLADKSARRNAGLDDSERSQNINIGMQLINDRLLQINLPPDALPEDDAPRQKALGAPSKQGQ